MPKDLVPELLARASEVLGREFSALPALKRHDGATPMLAAMAAVLEETARRLGDNYPYFHPLYAGQMLKPPHPVARAAYALAMTINPNNHARDGGRASSAMEIEAVAEIAAMFGWSEYSLGISDLGRHDGESGGALGGGTDGAGADELSGRSRRITRTIEFLPSLKLEYASVVADARGRMRLDALEDRAAQRAMWARWW